MSRPVCPTCLLLVAPLALLMSANGWADDAELLLGKWKVVSVVEQEMEQKAPHPSVEITADGLMIGESKDSQFAYKLRPEATPKEIDLVFDRPGLRVLLQGIYELTDDRLRICLAFPEEKRPVALESPVGSKQTLSTLERIQPE